MLSLGSMTDGYKQLEQGGQVTSVHVDGWLIGSSLSGTSRTTLGSTVP